MDFHLPEVIIVAVLVRLCKVAAAVARYP